MSYRRSGAAPKLQRKVVQTTNFGDDAGLDFSLFAYSIVVRSMPIFGLPASVNDAFVSCACRLHGASLDQEYN